MIAVAKNNLGPRKTKTRDKIEKIGNPVGILNEVIAVRMLTDDVEAVGSSSQEQPRVATRCDHDSGLCRRRGRSW